MPEASFQSDQHGWKNVSGTRRAKRRGSRFFPRLRTEWVVQPWVEELETPPLEEEKPWRWAQCCLREQGRRRRERTPRLQPRLQVTWPGRRCPRLPARWGGRSQRDLIPQVTGRRGRVSSRAGNVPQLVLASVNPTDWTGARAKRRRPEGQLRNMLQGLKKDLSCWGSLVDGTRWGLPESLGRGDDRTWWMLGRRWGEVGDRQWRAWLETHSGRIPRGKRCLQVRDAHEGQARQQHGKKARIWPDSEKEPDSPSASPDSADSVCYTLHTTCAICFIMLVG